MATVLIVPGLRGSGPDHWQTWWQFRDAAARRVEQEHWETPDLARWSGKVREALERAKEPAWIVAHSFGCLASIRAAADRPDTVAGALLVAPADPERFGIAAELPHQPLGFPTILVASTSDPWMPFERVAQWTARWGSRLVNLGPAGHINAESGFGPWPLGPRLLKDLQAEAKHQSRCSGELAALGTGGADRTKNVSLRPPSMPATASAV
jgi:predicted alpha/beta hydrolase family esterase